ncbi:MAG: phospholipase D-like domain-containing protein [Patescibacteria group bacterium]
MRAIIGSEYSATVVPLIDAARRSIDVIVFDWRWYTNDPGNCVQIFNQSIVSAVRRGVKVRVIGNSEDVLKILRSVGCETKKIFSKRLVHAKMILIDDCDIVVGSHNFSFQAFTLNQEISVYISDFPDAPRVLDYFNSLFSS